MAILLLRTDEQEALWYFLPVFVTYTVTSAAKTMTHTISIGIVQRTTVDILIFMFEA